MITNEKSADHTKKSKKKAQTRLADVESKENLVVDDVRPSLDLREDQQADPVATQYVGPDQSEPDQRATEQSEDVAASTVRQTSQPEPDPAGVNEDTSAESIAHPGTYNPAGSCFADQDTVAPPDGDSAADKALASDDILIEYHRPNYAAHQLRHRASGFGSDLALWSFLLFMSILLFGLAMMSAPLLLGEKAFNGVATEIFNHVPTSIGQVILHQYASLSPSFIYSYCIWGTIFGLATGFGLIALMLIIATRDQSFIDSLRATHLQISKHGLSLVWRASWLNTLDSLITSRKSPDYRISVPLIAWNRLSSVRIQTKGRFGERLNKPTLNFVQSNGRSIRLRAACLPSLQDWQLMIEKAKLYAPQVAVEPEVVDLLEQDFAQHKYTEIWLSALHTDNSAARFSLSDLAPGTTLQNGLYRIGDQIGRGGQGTAYLATTRQDNSGPLAVFHFPQQVVLKEYILPVAVPQNVQRQLLASCMKEVGLLQRLTHPNIVKLLDVFVEDHRTYLVFEHIQGFCLRETVENDGPLPEETVQQLAEQMCQVLSYLHGQEPPVVHQDFTPDNLILSSDGIVKLLDFNKSRQSTSKRTATIVGKPGFIAPEQFRGTPMPQSDTYSMGATLYFLLTGENPLPMTQSQPSRVRPSISTELDKLVWEMTDFDPEKRLTNAEVSNRLQKMRNRPRETE